MELIQSEQKKIRLIFSFCINLGHNIYNLLSCMSYAERHRIWVFFKFILTLIIFLNKFIYFFIFIFGCIGSALLRAGFLQLRREVATLRCGASASHCGGFSCCGAGLQACGLQQVWLTGSRAQAQQLWHTGLAAPRHVGSSRTRDRTCVPCIGRQILNHCTTREVLTLIIKHSKNILGHKPRVSMHGQTLCKNSTPELHLQCVTPTIQGVSTTHSLPSAFFNS